MYMEGRTGEQNNGGSQGVTARFGQQGDLISSGLHGQFYEQCYRGNLWTFGVSSTALSSTNAIATGVTATATPVIGVWNPATSGMNLVILMALVNTTVVANTAVAPGGFMWVYSAGNSAITTGSTPINLKTLAATGPNGQSVAKAFAVSTALTGMANSLAVLRASMINSINAAGPATAIHQPTNNPCELVNGAIIVPPGAVVGIMNQLSTSTVSVNAGLVWEEVPV